MTVAGQTQFLNIVMQGSVFTVVDLPLGILNSAEIAPCALYPSLPIRFTQEVLGHKLEVGQPVDEPSLAEHAADEAGDHEPGEAPGYLV